MTDRKSEEYGFYSHPRKSLSDVERQVMDRLRAAAEDVGAGAYAIAGVQPNEVVSQLIILSAELERLANVIEGRDRVN
ncbi:hypothetical protein KDD17_10785 [Sulfitobacter albidus]|uniref:Uncharacterized protein n=1 Tax=Sulfitobacter albidus TaxID=2829501 RepID=A0A975JBJ9_9RHOB|nr:hypothetical protein [Sulfitobacter albidus]QUJ75459.1 hypothetical protein KDD17_10785 [Sulfitobacter albidus]